jgi:hypothetical protein
MSRLFDGTDDQMEYAVSGLNVTAAHSTLMVIRIMRTADVDWETWMEFRTSGNVPSTILEREASVAGSVCWSNNSVISNTNVPATDSDGWMVIGSSVAAGTATGTVHRCIFGGANTHTAWGASLAKGASVTGGKLYLGGLSDFANFRLAAAAYWDGIVLADADYNAVKAAATTQSIADLSPTWLVDDSDAFATDLIGAMDRTAIVGTADDADDPSGWVYGIGGAPITDAPETLRLSRSNLRLA